MWDFLEPHLCSISSTKVTRISIRHCHVHEFWCLYVNMTRKLISLASAFLRAIVWNDQSILRRGISATWKLVCSQAHLFGYRESAKPARRMRRGKVSLHASYCMVFEFHPSQGEFRISHESDNYPVEAKQNVNKLQRKLKLHGWRNELTFNY